jgi:hypothetical protein
MFYRVSWYSNREEASHVTGTSAQENEDGVIVISDDDEE